mmetsp:Transcript_33609/g.111165  ORF Transcript_33609/g.111165 Transcript_33609/m.111165 type:complete len:344 (-) Transcript_33609:156-1187(-)
MRLDHAVCAHDHAGAGDARPRGRVPDAKSSAALCIARRAARRRRRRGVPRGAARWRRPSARRSPRGSAAAVSPSSTRRRGRRSRQGIRASTRCRGRHCRPTRTWPPAATAARRTAAAPPGCGSRRGPGGPRRSPRRGGATLPRCTPTGTKRSRACRCAPAAVRAPAAPPRRLAPSTSPAGHPPSTRRGLAPPRARTPWRPSPWRGRSPPAKRGRCSVASAACTGRCRAAPATSSRTYALEGRRPAPSPALTPPRRTLANAPARRAAPTPRAAPAAPRNCRRRRRRRPPRGRRRRCDSLRLPPLPRGRRELQRSAEADPVLCVRPPVVQRRGQLPRSGAVSLAC